MRAIVLKDGWALEHGHPHVTALFGLAVAEWFPAREQRPRAGNGPDCGLVPDCLDMNSNMRTDATVASLKWWKIATERSLRGREPLLSLALQGGIPVHVLRDGMTSSLALYIRAVMGQAWAHWPCDRGRVADLAMAEQGVLIQTLRGPVIAEQTVDTVLALCRLREILPDGLSREGDGCRVLNANEAGWRRSIPLHLPDDGPALDVLFCDILTEPPARMRPSARIGRILVQDAGRWRTGIVLPANGDIDARLFDLNAHGEGRFNLTLLGEAARAFPGTLGQMYWRPERGAIGAHLNCDMGRNGGVDVSGVRLSTSVRMRLTRADIQPFAMVWPGGEAVRSDVVAFREVTAGRYAMAGTGSVRVVEDHLMVMADESATVTARDGGTVERIGTVREDGLWRVEGSATVEKGTSRYLVVCGSDMVERGPDGRGGMAAGNAFRESAA